MSNNKNDMITLNLKKQRQGYYSISDNGIEITISNPFKCNGMGTDKWQLNILSGNNLIVNEWFATKKDAVKIGTNWVIENI